jgi:hypothetical protein
MKMKSNSVPVPHISVDVLKQRKRQAKMVFGLSQLLNVFNISHDAKKVEMVVEDAIKENRAKLEMTLSDILRDNGYRTDETSLSQMKAAIRACEL